MPTILKYVICDEDENCFYAEDCSSYGDTLTLLETLRGKNPDITYLMYGQIDA